MVVSAVDKNLNAKNIDEAHKIIRELDPKSRFMFSKLPNPEVLNEESKPTSENKDNSNIVDEKKEALV